ncbi:MAG: hypothetical protein ACP5G0_00175 [Desulfomonilia bacterium]
MSELSGKKAELDKDGIAFEHGGKAELDKDGISLEEGGEQHHPLENEGVTGDPDEEPNREHPRARITGLLISLVAVVIAGGVFALFLLLPKEEPEPIPESRVLPPAKIFVYEGDVILDPFMILYEPTSEHQTGILIAQMSLQAEPDMVPNVYRNIFDMRTIIYTRLSENIDIYSKNELAEMIRHDLEQYSIRDVAFIQFDMR